MTRAILRPMRLTTETGSNNAAVTVRYQCQTAQFDRLAERLAIQECCDPMSPLYQHKTRQLLEQLDEYAPQTPCLVVSLKELRDLLAVAGVQTEVES